MSASMAEVLEANMTQVYCEDYGHVLAFTGDAEELAEVLAADGYGKLEDAWDEGAWAYETRRARDESLPLTNPYRTREN